MPSANAFCENDFGQAAKGSLDDCKAPQKYKMRTFLPVRESVLAALFSALVGKTNEYQIDEFASRNERFLWEAFGKTPVKERGFRLARLVLRLPNPDRLQKVFLRLAQPLLREASARSFAGEASKRSIKGKGAFAEGDPFGENFVLASAWDSWLGICFLGNRADGKGQKQGEGDFCISPDLIEDFNIQGAFVAADAADRRVDFVEQVLRQSADYLLRIEAWDGRIYHELRKLFEQADAGQEQLFVKFDAENKETQRRTAYYRISCLSAQRLSAPFFKQWPGLRTGALVRVAFSTYEPGQIGKSELSTQYFLTSAAPAESMAKKVAGMMRMRRVLEKKNICRLSVCWEERFGAEPDCGGRARNEANQRELRKLALALLGNYRYCLWANGTNVENIEDITLEELQKRCEDPYAALECLVAGVGAL